MRGGLFGRHDLAGEQHLHRVLARHVARQRHHRRRAEQADIDAGRGEARRGRGDGEIAACDQLAARRRRHALHRGDHRLRQVDDLLHHGAAGRHDVAEIGAAAVGVGAPRGEFLEIVAGAERRPFGGEHDRAHAPVRRDAASAPSPSAAEQRLGQAVARRRPVERQHRDRPVVLPQQHGFGDGGAARIGCSSQPWTAFAASDSGIVSDLGSRASTASRSEGRAMTQAVQEPAR